MASWNAEKQQACKGVFKQFDKNGDGKVSKGELREVITLLHREPSDEDLQALMKHIDKDGSGFIEYDEFEKMMMALDEKIMASLRETFNAIDKDGNGYISMDEIEDLLKSLGVKPTEQELKNAMAEADTNQDNKISFEEFEKMMLKF
ncbi:calmodulin-A-like isoform X3 [Acanthaster planci]|uniref:Calmodulin-A-like isoform X3 n=1 Tax=Acanthaster planci TaxID=133434 RepID=A0A8B7YCL6_ACAPL|nr:calmodulin-A-like isoform X3 [Acanthaster planci]